MEDSRKWKIRPPKGLAEYIRKNCALNGYLIFSNKLDTAVCTTCNREFSMTKYRLPLVHERDMRKKVNCPLCLQRSIPKDARYGRKKLRDEGRIIWFRSVGRVTFMELDNFIIDYRTPHPAIYIAPYQQIRFTSDEQIRMDWKDGGWWGPGKWEQVGRITVRAPRTAMYYGALESTHVLWESLKDVGTDLRYADLRPERFQGEYCDEYDDAKRLVGYISAFLKYQSIELLEKAGIKRMVMQYAEGRKTRFMNIRGKTLRAILRLNGAEVRYIQKTDPGIAFLERIRRVRRYIPQARIEDIEDLATVITGGTLVDSLIETVQIEKVLMLIVESNRRHHRNMTIRDYDDYLTWITQLGLRKDKRTLYPKDFVIVHDEMMQRVRCANDRKILQEFRKSMLRITGMTEPFVRGEFLIRPADSPAELRNESAALEHCVRTYAERVANGRTSILFVRRVEDPDTPFFTLEYRGGEIVQCRGYKNCDYPEEVGEFIARWMKWMKKRALRMSAA